jgi:TIR domain
MQNYFVSWDSQDEGMVRPIVEALERHNRGKTIFWSKDSIRGGKVWDDVISKHLEAADGVMAVLTNNESGLNNFINFEIGGAIGGAKKLMIILAPGLSGTVERSVPLQRLQYTSWNDRKNLSADLANLELCACDAVVDELVLALTPYHLVSCRFGDDTHWHDFTAAHLNTFGNMVENRKTNIVVDNELVNCLDPCLRIPKVLEVTVERNGNRTIRRFQEGYRLKRSDLW